MGAQQGEDITAPLDLGGERLLLADGVELLGRYKGSGFKETPYLVKRGDGQVIQVTELIYRVATCLAAEYHLHQVASRVSIEFGRTVSVENVAYLVNQKLRPAGLILSPGTEPGAGTDGNGNGEGGNGTNAEAGPRSPRADAILSLRMRVPLVPARLHGTVTRLLLPLFRAPVIALGLAGLVAMNAWLAVDQRDELAAGVRDIIYQPLLVLLVTGLTLVAGAFHETGHATAARYGGATPGAMGAGVYLVWPVFYTDVTDSYRLSRRGRLRTDLGGVYFNVLFTLAAAGLYLATGFRPLLVYLVLAQVETLRQFLPFVRLDGYYVVSDLAGVPNLFTYMQPVLATLFKRRDPEVLKAARAKLDELTPRARKIITAWVAITAPVLLANVVVLVVLLPRLAGAALGSAGSQLRQITGADGFDPLTAANGLVGMFLLGIPVLGMSYIAVRLVEKVVAATRTIWRSRPQAAAIVTTVASALAAWQLGFVWPDAFASALLQAQQATVTEVAAPSGGDAGTELATGPAADDRDDDGDLEREDGAIDGVGEPGASPSVTGDLVTNRPTTVPPVPATSSPLAPVMTGASSGSAGAAGGPAPSAPGPPQPHPGDRGDDGDPLPRPRPTTPPSPPTTASPNLVGDLLEAIFAPPQP